MLLLGCKPKGRFIEQHDIFFGISASLSGLIPQIKKSWPEANGILHIDAWREVTKVDGFEVSIKKPSLNNKNTPELFFINLGGYLPGEFDERHYKILVPAYTIEEAKKSVKQQPFFKTHDLAHIDDKFPLDIDDIFPVNELLVGANAEYEINLKPATGLAEDTMHLGYFQLHKLNEEW